MREGARRVPGLPMPRYGPGDHIWRTDMFVSKPGSTTQLLGERMKEEAPKERKNNMGHSTGSPGALAAQRGVQKVRESRDGQVGIGIRIEPWLHMHGR